MLSWIKQRIASRPDSELEQTILRLVLTFCFYAYLLPMFLFKEKVDISYEVYLAMGVYLFSACTLFILCLLSSKRSPFRRVFANITDVSITSFLMIHGGFTSAAMFFIYLFVTIGNGFRFGKRYLDISLALSLVGFSIVIFNTSFWFNQFNLAIGVAIGISAISIYSRTLISRLYDAIKKSEIANEAKRRFLSTVTHEMRTPLNAIIGMSDLLKETPLNSDQKEMLGSVSTASNIMLRLVEDVLDFSKIEAGKLVLESQEFDVYVVAKSLIKMLEGQAKAKGLRLHSRVTSDIRPTLIGDAFHLKQVLINLLGNAIKFTETGEIVLQIELLENGLRGQRLRFSIEDTGIGMSQDALKKIFESFTQADESTTRRFGGTGLGTTISKQLIELMGGSIHVESQLGKGSRFWFDLDFESPSVDTILANANLPEGVHALLLGFPEYASIQIQNQLLSLKVAAEMVADIDTTLNKLALAKTQGRNIATVFVWADNDKGLLLEAATAIHRVSPAMQDLPLVLCCPPDLDVNKSLMLSVGYGSLVDFPVDRSALYNILHAHTILDESEKETQTIREYYEQLGGQFGLNILVAEDNLINQKVVARILELIGCQVTLVEDGEMALDAVEQETFDLIILDMNMPKLGGMDTARALRMMQVGGAQTPLVMLSANVGIEVINEAKQAGINTFLPKPVEGRKLIEVLVELCPGGEASVPLSQIHTRGMSDSRFIVQSNTTNLENKSVLNLNQLEELKEISASSRFLSELIIGFLQDNQNLLAQMDMALLEGRFEGLKDHAHAMKGASSNIGAEQLVEICSVIGKMTHAELAQEGESIMQELRQVAASVRLSLADYLKSSQL